MVNVGATLGSGVGEGSCVVFDGSNGNFCCVFLCKMLANVVREFCASFPNLIYTVNYGQVFLKGG